jgi:hypothetical protein
VLYNACEFKHRLNMMMRLPVLMLALLALLGLGGCDKYNQVDNSGTVKTPYVLFIGGYAGTLHKTNEALYFNTLFPTDNSCVRQVLVADTNVLYLKRNLYVSKDEGRSFKDCNLNAIDFIDEFYKYFYPNQMVYDKASKKVYFMSKTGIQVSTDLGETFAPETDFDPGNTAPVPGFPPTSITQLDNGKMFVMYDSSIQYVKAPGGSWREILADGTGDLPWDTTWYFASTHDTLIAIDFFGKYGVLYSTDDGATWATLNGMPKSRKFLFGNEAFGGETFYLGLDSGGLYRLNGTTFNATGAGMPWFSKVSYVEGKRVVYRTDVMRYYLFCATDQGLYISETNGLDWKLIRNGTYSTLE